MLEDHKHKHPTHDFDGITENRVNSPPAYFNVLFYGLVIWGIAFMAYFLFSGWSSDAEFQAKMADHQQASAAAEQATATESGSAGQGGSTAPAGPDLAAGEQLYASNCAMCHGAEGEGGIGPSLQSDYSYGSSREAVHESIAMGRPNGMPKFSGQLSGEQLDNLTGFVLSLQN